MKSDGFIYSSRTMRGRLSHLLRAVADRINPSVYDFHESEADTEARRRIYRDLELDLRASEAARPIGRRR
jgi:hypothetical protein